MPRHNRNIRINRIPAIIQFMLAAGLVFSFVNLPVSAADKTLLNDSWTDGNRTSTNLPTDSPTWIGQSSGNGSSSATPGALNFVLPTNSLKAWEYFTSNNSAPDGNQPHSAVTHLNVGDTLMASMTFTLTGTNATSTAKNFRFGLFLDPTDARVQSNSNSDSGGGTNPWSDATGYAIQIPINNSSTGGNPLQLEKRTNNSSGAVTSLLGDSTAYTTSGGGSSFAFADTTSYTAQLALKVVSLAQLDVTATILQDTNVLSTVTKSDTGTAFGGTSNAGSITVNGQVVSSSIYRDFDQLFLRNSSNAEVTGVTFTNWNVTLSSNPPAPIPGDLNRDGVFTADDIPAMLTALTDLSRYKSVNNVASDDDLKVLADLNGDGVVSNRDIQPLLDMAISSGFGSIAAVPEPATSALIATGLLVLPVFRRGKR